MKNRCSFILFPLSFILLLSTPLLASEDFSLEQEISISLEVLESLAKLKEDPLDINSATYDELLLIPYLSPVLCMRIIHYRKDHSFMGIDDLVHIAGINELLLEKIKPCITVKRKFLTMQRGEVSFRSIVGRKSPRDTSYEGNPFAVSNKLRYSKGSFFTGATAFKDPYEKNYADFYVLYAGMKNDNIAFIFGDYAVDIGERLISGYPGFVFKSSGMVKGRETIAKPYTSGFEDFAYRGGVLEKKWRKFDTALFLSRNMLDGTFENDTIKRVIYETGYHRTQAELDKKNRIEERVAGATAAIGNTNFKVRTTILSGWYDKQIKPDQVHYYRFCGRKYSLAGFHIRYAGPHISLWSEYALSYSTKGAAFILGITAKPRHSSIVMLYRDYGETYFAPRAFAFCETEIRNERGLYSFISTKLPPHIRFTGYLDIFSRPFPTYFNVLPTSGYEAFLSMETKMLGATICLRFKHKQKNNYQWLDESLTSVRHNLRCSLKIPIDQGNTFAVLLQGGLFGVPEIQMKEQGYLINVNIKSRFLNNATAESGFVLFATDSYNSRMYLFINDIPGILCSRPFYGHGFDGYILAKARFGAHLRFYVKFEIEKKDRTIRIYRFGIEWR